jgi:hypothetical protein
VKKKFVYFDDEDDDCQTHYLQTPSYHLTLDPYWSFTSMVQRYAVSGDWGTFFEFARVH